MSNAHTEHKRQSLSQFQLPHSFKRIGLITALAGFVSLMVTAAFPDNETFKIISKYALLIGLLILSISKEEIEDEFIISLRMKSFMLAFIICCSYSLLMPLIDHATDIMRGSDNEFTALGDFLILWVLLCSQLFCFEFLKRQDQ